jgi:hypothetical protein
MVRQQEKLSVNNTRPQNSAVRTISGNCRMAAPSGPHATASPVTHALRHMRLAPTIFAASCLFSVQAKAFTAQNGDLQCAVAASIALAELPMETEPKNTLAELRAFFLGRLSARAEKNDWQKMMDDQTAQYRGDPDAIHSLPECLAFYDDIRHRR